MVTRAVKIKLAKGDARGMYLLFNENEEVKTDRNGNTIPPNRAYKIQIEVEAMYKNKRSRGKKLYSIQKGTSIVKACLSLIQKRVIMIETLKEKGTLKVEKVLLKNIKNDTKNFRSCFDKFIQNRKIATRRYGLPASENTIRGYQAFYNKYLVRFEKRNIDTITADDIEKLRNYMINKGLKAATIKPLKVIMKQLLEDNDIFLNWNKIVFPTADNVRKYDKNIDETIKIFNLLYNYLPESSNRKYEINAIFKLLLTGRRISECANLRYEYLDLKQMKINYPRTITKTKRDYEFALSTDVLEAIKLVAPLKKKGKIFTIHSKTILVHFKNLMNKIGIHDMHLHDLRALVGQTALNNGATLFDVATLLAHSSTKTTEQRYVQGNLIQSSKALELFRKTVNSESDIIDVEIIEDEFTQLKKIYPNAADKKIYKIMEIMSKD